MRRDRHRWTANRRAPAIRSSAVLVAATIILSVALLLGGCEWLAVGHPLISARDAAIVGGPEDDDAEKSDIPMTNGKVASFQKISDLAGSFNGILEDGDAFGWSSATCGDLDGDGIDELAVGATGDDDGGSNRGAVWILFLDSDGKVRDHQKISDLEGNFGGTLADEDLFGRSIVSLGDLDGDGVRDLAVGAAGDDDGGTERGAVWILFLDTDGTVKNEQKISDTAGGFTGTLIDHDGLGYSVTSPGDINNDGTRDLVVGAYLDDTGGAFGANRGAVWVLFMESTGMVENYQKISDTDGGFTGTLEDDDHFGASVTSRGDLNGDGTPDVIVGADLDDDGGANRGAVWVLYLDSDGTVQDHRKISSTAGGFTSALSDDDSFGWSSYAPGDLDGNGTVDFVVGAPGDDDGGIDHGAAWVLF
jgi:hypothetical protein